MNAKASSYWGTSFALSAVWFSTHCGGGFATGNQEVNFYVKYGYPTFFLPIIAMFFVAWAYRNGLAIAKDHKAHDYRSFANAFYHPYEKIFAPIFEICLIINILIAVSTSIAGAGALLDRTLGVPYVAGIVALGMVLLILTIFGGDLVIRVLKYKAYFLIVTLIILCYLGFQIGESRWERIFVARETFGTDLFPAVWSMILYVGFQSFGMTAAISMSHHLETTEQCNVFGVFGVLLNGTFLAVVCIMLAGFAPDILKETLPVYYVTSKLDIAWLKILYSVILFVALIGTAISFVFTAVARFERLVPAKGVLSGVRARRVCVSLLTIILCVCASSFGLTALVVKGYGFVGYLGLAFVILPLLTVGTVRIYRADVLRRQQPSEVGA